MCEVGFIAYVQNFEAHVEPPDVPVVPAAMLAAVKVIEQMIKASQLPASRKTTPFGLRFSSFDVVCYGGDLFSTWHGAELP